MRVVKIVHKVEEYRKSYDEFHTTHLYIDGQEIDVGSYGGEPEDNSYYRTYNWVEPMLKRLAEILGAKVEFEIEKETI